MKKLLVILIMMVYGFSTTGMTVHLHYCCGKLKKVDWIVAKDDQCGSQHKMGSKPCCETKAISKKLATDQVSFHYTINDFKSVNDVEKPEIEVFSFKLPEKRISPFASPSPPLKPLPLFISNCVFRI